MKSRTVRVALVWPLAIACCFGGGMQAVCGFQDGVAAPNKSSTVTHVPAQVTAYDVMTAEDEFYYYILSQLCLGGDVAEWPLVRQLLDLGGDIVDATTLARAANLQINISEQPRAARIRQMVNECSQILGVRPPPVYIEGSPVPNAWVAGLESPHVLVLTSALLELYQESPEELRFIIGHELGHIKAQHLRTLLVGRIVAASLASQLVKVDADSIGGVLASGAQVFVFGTLMHWYRAAEYSADRAGLICVGGRVDVAQQALMRLLHWTKPSNALFSEESRFEVPTLIEDQRDLRHRPFVQVVSLMYEYGATHPFVVSRCGEIERWSRSMEYEQLMTRPAIPRLRLQIDSVSVQQIPETDTYVPLVDSGETDPLVKLTVCGVTQETQPKTDCTAVQWTHMGLQFDYEVGAGILVDLYDYNNLLPNKRVGAALLPVSQWEAGSYQVRMPLQLDLEGPDTRVNRPVATVAYRLIQSDAEESQPATP